MNMNSELLEKFTFERVLNEDPATQTIVLLGTLPERPRKSSQEIHTQAIIRIERSPLPGTAVNDLKGFIDYATLIESTDIYSWFLAWTKKTEGSPDVKINVICPATEVHIRKYSSQQVIMINETPALYEQIVKPYILAFPPSRTQWVEDILTGVSEADKVLFRDESPTSGFVILPDMKWDLINLSNLYLVAISLDRNIRCLRDLKKVHIPMLQRIRSEAHRIVNDKWGLQPDKLRLYIHYQPSYYHFHVHIVNANYVGLMGMTVGQAHLLEDIISLLELSPDEGPTILDRMTLTYSIGERHNLYESIKEHEKSLMS